MYDVRTIRTWDVNPHPERVGGATVSQPPLEWYDMPTEEELNQMYEFYLHEDGKYRVINKH